MSLIRPTAVAGAFYPDRPDVLEREVTNFLAEVEPGDFETPKAIIAPHAGYRFSGTVAARIYARLAPLRGVATRVILLGPCHRVAVRGLAAPSADAFASPLGNVMLDRETILSLLDLPQVVEFDETHAQEHSLEVHLPFLQCVLGDFALVPLVVGDATTDDVAEVLDAVWGGPETVIVVSSDLSHFLDYEAACEIDSRTRRAIEALAPSEIGREQACGRVPVKGLLQTAKRRHMSVETVDIRNSGDTAGPRDRVVGYGAWAFVERDGQRDAGVEDADGASPAESPGQARDVLNRFGATLLSVAAGSIEHGLEFAAPLPTEPARFGGALSRHGACFVTLKKNGKLRGCIGSPEAHRPLVVDIAENAFRAAFKDPRFPPLSSVEIPSLALSISLLSAQSPIVIHDEDDLLAQMRPGIDGLVISDRGRRALLLPSVWEQLPDAGAFLAHLKRKAGMAADHWSPGFQAYRFTAAEINQQDLPAPPSIWKQHG